MRGRKRRRPVLPSCCRPSPSPRPPISRSSRRTRRPRMGSSSISTCSICSIPGRPDHLLLYVTPCGWACRRGQRRALPSGRAAGRAIHLG